MVADYYDYPMGSGFLSSRSITDADRDGGRKLARLRRGCGTMPESDFSGSCISGFGSSPSRYGPSGHNSAYGRSRDLPPAALGLSALARKTCRSRARARAVDRREIDILFRKGPCAPPGRSFRASSSWPRRGPASGRLRRRRKSASKGERRYRPVKRPSRSALRREGAPFPATRLSRSNWSNRPGEAISDHR